MDIGRAFVYFAEDVNWIKKVLIGGVVNLIPIVNFAALGYWLAQTKRIYEAAELPLLEWDNFADYFVKGLIATVGMFIYSLPILVLYCCIAFLAPAMAGAGANQNEPGPLAGLGTIFALCFGCLALLYGLALIVFLPALLTRFAITNDFGALFQFAPAWQMIQANPANYGMALIGYLIASFIAGFGIIACLIGVVFTSFWSGLVAAYLFGHFAKEASAASMMPPPPMTPLAPPPMEPTIPG